MSTFDAILHLEKPADGDTTWGANFRQDLDTVGKALAPQRTYFVSPDFTTAAMFHGSATDRRHFDTIQAAITKGESLALDAEGYTIVVFPGVYNERLVITRSVAIVGLVSHGPRFFPGGNTAQLRGDNAANEVIQITPAESLQCRVLLANLRLDNRYNVSNATEITEPYLIDIADQTLTGGAANTLSIINCAIRMQTWGLNNKWTYGILIDGWWDVDIEGCQVGGLNFAGGAVNGGVRKLVAVHGRADATKKALLSVFNSRFSQLWSGTGTAFTYRVHDTVDLFVALSHASQAAGVAVENSGTGTNTIVGVNGGDPATYHNIFGIDLVRW